MSAIASINFKKSNVIQTRHNDRTLAPSYLISDSGCECNRSHEIAIKLKKQIIENAKEAYKTSCKARNKKFQAKSYEWSAVCNIKEDTTMADLERLAKHFEDEYGFQCYQIAIHRDEGHLDDDGEKIINHHAHLEFITLDKHTGKNMYRRELISPKILRQIQTEVAEILGMKRGLDKRLSNVERVEPRKYAQMKEQERKEQAKLEAEHKKELEAKNQEIQELIQAKELESKEVEAYIEQFRKNCANKGLPKEFFRKISNLKKQAKPTIKELLDDTLNSLLQSYLKEKERNIELENENETLKAQNQELEAKIETLLTQEQIQEIINQALAQKKAEIAEKEKIIQAQNQEISKLKAEKEQFQKLLETKEKISKQDQEQKNEVIQTQNQEKTTNNEIKYYSQLFDLIQDDVSTFQTTNTDKTEVPKQNQTQNQKNYLPLSDLIQDDVSLNQKEEQEEKSKKLRKNK